MDKPHLVLFWTFDIPNNLLYCDVDENLRYISHEGGTLGYTKLYRLSADQDFVKTHITPEYWEEYEKYWISEHYGDKVGYFQPDYNRVLTHPIENRPDPSPMGVGPDGRYLDHMQRMQIILEGEDCARIGFSSDTTLYITPDGGKTIYKRLPTRDVEYSDINDDPLRYYPDHSQPCMMQPRTPGVRLSNHNELLQAGFSAEVYQKCINGEWALPKHPELQKWYVYPTL